MLKYKIFFQGFGGRLWDAFESNYIPEDIDFDCIDDAVFHLATWIEAGSARNDIKYVFLAVYSV